MNPLKLTLTGFKGIKAGLGLDQVTVDLTMLGDLIAITGPNGAGKTTVLDNLHPYRVLPSRAQSYAPGGTSYYDHTFGQAQKFLRWEHNGNVYESTIVIKGATKTKTQECYLHQIVPAVVGTGEARMPVSLPDGTISDGKTANYDRCVEAILGTPEMYFTAAFSCQGRRSLADYTNGDIKGLMSELLGLDAILELGTEANDVAKGKRNSLVALRERVARAGEIETLQGANTLRISDVDTRLVELSDTKEVARAALADANRRLAEAQAGAAAQADVERRRTTLTAQLAAVGTREDAGMKQIEQEAKDVSAELHTAASHADAAVVRARVQITDTEKRIASNAQLAATREHVELSERLLSDQETALLPAAVAAVTEAEAIVEQIAQADKAYDAATATLKQINGEGHALKATCEDLHRRAGLVEDVPCKGTEMQSRCQLLAEAVEAKAKVPATEQELKAKRAERSAAAVAVETAEAARDALHAKRPALSALRTTVTNIQARIRDLAATVTTKGAVDAADAQLVIDRAALAEMTPGLAAAIEHAADCTLRLQTVGAARAKKESLLRGLHDDERGILQAEIDALPPTDTQGLQVAQQRAAGAEHALADIDASISAAHGEQATLLERARHLDLEAASLATDVARAATMEDDIAQWTLLSKALGADGIVALCIDDAGPTLTTHCNDLLAACYGPRFTVSLKTQEETKAGTMKETFDIVVFDAERGDAKSIRDVSGGERVYLNEAMTRAIALYQAQASGRQYGCLFSDESDGALDTEKKRQYARMKRKVLEIGGYAREIYISHSAEVQEAADATIYVPSLAA